eukprot:4674173-Prymnesium_polylepis.1
MALDGSAFRIERLPGPAFAGNCWFGPPEDPPWCDVHLFHAHCTSPGVVAKQARMRTVLHESRHCAESAGAARAERGPRSGGHHARLAARNARTRRRAS